MRRAIIIGLLAIAALGAGGYFFMKSKKVSDADEETVLSKDMPPPDPVVPADKQNPSTPEPSQQSDLLPSPGDAEVHNPEPKPSVQPSTGHFEITVPNRHLAGSSLDDKYADLVDRAREKQIWKILRKKGAAHAKWAKIRDVRCRGKVCTIDASAKTSNTRAFQAAMADLPKLHPWLGNKIDVTTPIGDPSQGQFVYFLEIAK